MVIQYRRYLIFLLLVYLPTLASATLTDGLVAYYPLDGNAQDLSENGNDGAIFGAVSDDDRHGNSEGAFRFDGRDDYGTLLTTSEMNQVLDTSAGSFSVWVKPFEQTELLGNVFHMHNPGHNDRFYLGLDWPGYESRHGFGFGDAGIGVDMPLQYNQWQNFIGTWDSGGTIKLYYNGQLVGTGTFGNPGFSFAPGNALHLGSCSYWSERNYHGLIDDFRIYNRVLTASEIAQINDAIPEPATMLAGLAGLAGIGRYLRRRK